MLTAQLVLAAGNASRGKYLVNEVAKCGDCHTPVASNGLDQQKWLKGTALPFQPLQPVPGWSSMAPDLTSTGPLWRGWGEAGIRKFLETGLDPSGHAPGPPMPAYKLRANDAGDMAAYLKTLK